MEITKSFKEKIMFETASFCKNKVENLKLVEYISTLLLETHLESMKIQNENFINQSDIFRGKLSDRRDIISFNYGINAYKEMVLRDIETTKDNLIKNLKDK